MIPISVYWVGSDGRSHVYDYHVNAIPRTGDILDVGNFEGKFRVARVEHTLSSGRQSISIFTKKV